ncbi:MAG: GldG family protein [Oscillospiraceae bacterium]
MKIKFLSDRRFKHGSLATIITIGFVVAVVVINFIATLLLERFPLDIDLTKDSRFTLTQDTVDYVKGIKDPVTMTICVSESQFKNSGEYFKQAYEVIENYTKYNPLIKTEYVDLLKNPTFVQKYPTETIAQGDIIIEAQSTKRIKKIAAMDLFNVTQGNQFTGEQEKISSKAEQVMTGALMYVSDKNPTTVSLIQTGSNSALTDYVALLKQNNYAVETVNILTQDINKDSKIVLLPAPKNDLTKEELKKIDAFLDNDGEYGKTLMFIASQDQSALTNVDEFLAEWGIKVNPGIILETDQNNAVAYAYNPINKVVSEEHAKLLKNPNTFFVTSYAHPIEQIFTEKDSRTTTPLVQTAPSAVIMPADADDKFDASKQEKNTMSTVVKSDKTKFEGTDPKVSSVITFAAESMLSSPFITNANFTNGDFVIQLANLASGKEDTIKIVPVNFEQSTIQITPMQISIYSILFTIVIPVALLVIGLVVWLRRRHL